MKRSQKFYRKNEREVMEKFGLKPTVNSGSGWIEKEDGQSEHIICQLKSTDAQSIGVKLRDLKVLESNAVTVNKIPMFVIEFLQTSDTYIIVRPEDIQDLVDAMDNKYIIREQVINLSEPDDTSDAKKSSVKMIKSSSSKRDSFMEENKSKFAKREKRAT